MVKTGQFTTKCKGNKVIGLKQQISFSFNVTSVVRAAIGSVDLLAK